MLWIHTLAIPSIGKTELLILSAFTFMLWPSVLTKGKANSMGIVEPFEETKLGKILFLFLISLSLFACANKVANNSNLIVLGVVRSWANVSSIYTIAIDGTGTTGAHLPSKLNSQPEWSPDGNWVIFSTQYQVGKPEDSAIYLMRADGSERRLIIHGSRGSFDPAWSPDGTRIAYYGRDFQSGIYALNVECYQQFQSSCNPTPTFLAEGNSAPDWSPDGNYLAYENNGNIFRIDSDGNGTEINLTPNMTYCANPKWSPDGTRILFSCFQSDHHDILVMMADGSNLINLTNGVGSNVQPEWSPDGSKIAFISNRGDLGKIVGIDDTVRSNAIFLMNKDGTNVLRLSLRSDEHILWFTWLP